MPIYRGRGVPGDEDFFIEEFQGFHTSPNGKYWGSGPIRDDGMLVSEYEELHKKKHKSKYF